MRKEYQAEDGGAYEGEGGEEPEVVQQRGGGEDQGGEGGNGRETAQSEGIGHFHDYAFRIVTVVAVCDDVYGIAQGHAQHRGSRPHGYGGNAALDEVDQAQGEKAAVCYWRDDQRYGCLAAEGDAYQQYYGQQSYEDREQGVFLNDFGIACRHTGRAEIFHFHPAFFRRFRAGFFQLPVQSGVGAGLAHRGGRVGEQKQVLHIL